MLNNIFSKDDWIGTEIFYVPVQVLRYDNVQASMINQNLNFKIRGMKGKTEGTWTGQQNRKPLPL